MVVHFGSPPADFVDAPYFSQIVHFHNFESLAETKGDVVESPEFSYAGQKWVLQLYPHGDNASKNGRVSIFIASTTPTAFGGDLKLEMKYAHLTLSRNFSKTETFKLGGERWGWHDFVHRQDVTSSNQRVLNKGTLTLEVTIKPDPGNINPFVKESGNSTAFLNDKFADVAFKVKGQIFPSHKIILSCHAPELAELCETFDVTSPMPIDDVEPDIFQLMLGFIYDKAIDESEWRAQAAYLIDPSHHNKSILRAAGKYGICNLKSEAEFWYVRFLELTVDNVIDNLLYADGNNLLTLRKAAKKFIVHEAKNVFSSSYSRISESPALLQELLVMEMAEHMPGNKRKRDD
eukprot:scaffold10172_cov62-Cyclotella_meneghiniana.AAC.10